jgi:hypothetical protein
VTTRNWGSIPRSRFSFEQRRLLRQRRRRVTVEKLAVDCLDVRELKRLNIFRDHWVTYSPSFRWPKISKMRVARYRIILELEDRTVPQNIRVSWTTCRFGGARPWFHCPYCDRRVALLYWTLAAYVCRHCPDNPPYASQTKSAAGRRHFALCKLRLQLGANAKPGTDLPDRPPGMHRRTYRRLRARIEALERVLAPRLRSKAPDYQNLIYYFR